MPVVVASVDGPKCRLLAIPAPIRRSCPAYRVPARFVLPMIVAPAERKPILGPDDLGAHIEAGSLQGLLDLACMPAGVPDIGDRAKMLRRSSEEFPAFSFRLSSFPTSCSFNAAASFLSC